jgi:hypothetical protein
MTPDDLKVRTKQFAVDVVRFAKTIPKDHINDEIASTDRRGDVHSGSLSSSVSREIACRFHQ